MKLNRQAIQRMVDTGQLNIGGRKTGGGGGGIGGGGVSSQWVEENYISKEFFNSLFTIHGLDANDNPITIDPNDTDKTFDSIEALVDFWSVGNVSALGPAGSGGGGGLTLNEPLSSINSANLGTPTSNGQVIMWNAALSKWVYGIPSGGGGGTGTVTNINTGVGLTGGPITSTGTIEISSTYLTYIAHGETAYGWGDHAQAGYLTASSTVITNLEGYFDANGVANEAAKLSTAQNLWGQSFDGSAEVKGTLEHVTNIHLQELSANTGAQIKFFYGGANSTTSSIYENQSGSLSINGQIFVTNNGNVGIGGSASGSYKLNISGDAKASNLESAGYVTAGTSVTAGTTLNAGTNVIAGAADGTFIQIGNIRIGYDQTNDALEVYKLSGTSHASANLYARGNVSALGPAGSGGGGGVSLNHPLSDINSANLGTPSTNGTILIWRSAGGWQYGQQSGITMDTVWNQLSNPTNQQINISHLTNALSGYSTTDTKNTTGIYQSNEKLYLVGSQSLGTTSDAYAVTNTNAYCYIGKNDHCLYSNGSKVAVIGDIPSSSSFVTIGDAQTITGAKTFSADTQLSRVGINSAANQNYRLYVSGTSYNSSDMTIGGALGVGGLINSYKLYVTGGTAYFTSRVGIGGAPFSAYMLFVAGKIHADDDITSDGNIYSTSDIRRKNFIEYVDNISMMNIANSPIFRFTWKDRESGVRIGTAAQYIKTFMPEVTNLINDKMSMDYSVTGFVFSVLTARKVVDHECRINKLEAEFERLKAGQ